MFSILSVPVFYLVGLDLSAAFAGHSEDPVSSEGGEAEAFPEVCGLECWSCQAAVPCCSEDAGGELAAQPRTSPASVLPVRRGKTYACTDEGCPG